MSSYRPQIGASLQELDTPVMIVDLEALEHNFDVIADTYADSPTKMREHAKNIKTPIILHKQIRAGGTMGGICTAKTSEAEVMVEGGIEPILITSPIATRGKLARLLALARQAPKLQIVTDRLQNVRDLNDGATAVGIKLQVFVDLNAGDDRTGIMLGESAITLAGEVARAESLELVGVQAYAGRLQHVVGWEARRKQYVQMMGQVMETVTGMRQAGLDVSAVTGGGTGTYDINNEIDHLIRLMNFLMRLKNQVIFNIVSHG